MVFSINGWQWFESFSLALVTSVVWYVLVISLNRFSSWVIVPSTDLRLCRSTSISARLWGWRNQPLSTTTSTSCICPTRCRRNLPTAAPSIMVKSASHLPSYRIPHSRSWISPHSLPSFWPAIPWSQVLALT